MSFAPQRSLAMMTAEDGDLHEAEETLSTLIDRIEREIESAPSDPGLRFELGRSLNDRASVRAWARRPAEALEDLRKVEALADGLKPVNRMSLRVNLLDTRARLLGSPFLPVHDTEAAEAALARLREETNVGDGRWIADAVEMDLAMHREDWNRVAAISTQLIARLLELGHARGANAVRAIAARAWLQLGQPDKAAEAAECAHVFFDREGPPDIAASAAIALARARGGAEDWDLAERALSLIEQLTRAQRTIFDQQRFLVEKLRIFDDALRLALAHLESASTSEARNIGLRRAWQVAERAKSFSLRQAMTQGGWLRAMDAEAAAELAEIDERLDALEAQGNQSDTVAGARSELLARRQRVLQEAMQRNPRIAQAQSAPLVDLNAILRSLPDGVGAISWYWLKEPDQWRLHIFHAGSDRLPRHFQTSWSWAEMEEMTKARQKSAAAKRPFLVQPMLPATLGDRLFPPSVLETLDRCHTLLMTPHRFLRQLPLHAAEITSVDAVPIDGADATGASKVSGDATGFLIQRFAVQVLPTLALPFPDQSTFDVTRSVLLIGCGRDGFPGHAPLDDASLELQNIASLWSGIGGRVEVHPLGPENQLDTVAPLSRWTEFHLIHLACHGSFEPDSPLSASLYLGGRALRASEFFGVRLRCEVVCLSACSVGQQGHTLDGMALASDEWLGLALPLFQSGARNLLASLWVADSSSARLFMETFHLGLARGLSPPLAYREACLSQIKLRFGFWANWQLAGFPTSDGGHQGS